MSEELPDEYMPVSLRSKYCYFAVAIESKHSLAIQKTFREISKALEVVGKNDKWVIFQATEKEEEIVIYRWKTNKWIKLGS